MFVFLKLSSFLGWVSFWLHFWGGSAFGNVCFLELSSFLGWVSFWKCLFFRTVYIFGVGQLLEMFVFCNCLHFWGGAAFGNVCFLKLSSFLGWVSFWKCFFFFLTVFIFGVGQLLEMLVF